METLTIKISDFAKQKGVTVDAVSRAIRDGRLRESVVKTQGKYPRLLPDVALREWAENTTPGHGGNHAKQASEADSDDAPASFAASRAKREHYQAELARLELETKQASLVPADEVRKQAFSVARQVRDQLLNIPDRVAAELASVEDQFEIHRLLTGEIRKALESALAENVPDLP